MAEKISVQIALEGGAEIERQLADIGKAGQQAFQQIASAAEKGGGLSKLDPQVLTDAYKKFGVTAAAEINKIQGVLQAAVNLERVASGVRSLEGYFERVGTAAKALGNSLTGPLTDAANRMLSILGPLGGIARALGPVGIAAGAAFGSMVKGAFDAAASINELSAAAMKLNVPTQQLHKFQLGMEAAGISAKAIASGLGQVNSLVEKSQLDRVNNTIKELQDAATRGFGAFGTQQLLDLQEAAKGVGPAAYAARKALETLGLPIPGAGARDIKELGIELARLRGLGVDIKVDDTAVTAIQKMIAAVQKMPDGMQRSALAIKLFGETAGPELVAAMRTGSLAVDQFTQRYSQLTKQQELEAAKFEQSFNKLGSTWQRFNSLTFSPAMRIGFDWVQKEIVAFQNDLIGLGSDLTKFGQAAALVWNDPMAALGHLGQAIARVGADIAASPIAQLITQWVTTPVGNAWQWIVDTFNSVVGFFGGLISQAQGLFAAWVTTPIEGAWQWIIDTFNSALGWLSGAIATATGLITQWVTTPIASAWQWIVDAWNAMLAKIGLKGGAAAEAPAAGGQGFAGGGWVGGRGSGTSDSNLAWVSRGEYITPARIVQQPGVLAFLEALRRSGNLHRAMSGAPRFAAGGLIPSYATGGPVNAASIGPKLQQVFEIMKQGLQIGWAGAEQAFKSLNQISTGIDRSLFGVGEALLKNMERVDQTLLQGMNILKGLADSIGLQRRAGGGLLGGRGTGTSDSNLAWVSRGEYITPARAVRQPGVLAFLEALRRSGGNLRELLDGMGHFALGGMVRTPLPSFAGGGGGMSNVTIQFPGLPEITGLRASSGVVDELRKAAALAQVRSGGRKPSRYS